MSRIAVIVPVYNGTKTLTDCLAAINLSRRVPDELIVVDDSSTDDSAALAESFGARVIRLEGGPSGPGFARNRGAESTTCDILVFVDSDVVVHPDSLGQIESQFNQNPSVHALFGSYDDSPTDQGVVSRYKNLLHHHVHQNGRSEATTFWAGCGAVRQDAFRAVEGFNQGYRTASIEDIELGHRLIRAGFQIRLCPEILCTHLKRWTFLGLLRCDIFQRAVPWSRLIGSSHSVPNDLNLGWNSRLGALAAWTFVGCLLLFFLWPGALLGATAAGGTVLACNLGLFRMFLLRCGLVFSICAFLLHLLYLMYSSGVFAIVAGPSLVARCARISVRARS